MSEEHQPRFADSVFIAPTAYVGGDVLVGSETSIMYNAVIRGDIAPIRIGSRVNIQDGSIVHTPYGEQLDIGDEVGIGHRAVIHCRSIGSRTLVGIGAILLDGCRIGSRCIIAAGTVLPPGTEIPDEKLVMGVPGKVIRDLVEDDLETIDHVVRSYVEIGRLHAEGRFPNTFCIRSNKCSGS